MLGLILTMIFLLSVFFAALASSAAETGAAVLEGAQAALSFCLGIGGSLCFWSALLELTERCGLASRLSSLLRPPLRLLFPRAARDEEALAALSENVGANLLGLGNAATPAGIRAVRAIARLGEPAYGELGTLVVINTASIQLLPGTIAAVRAAAGASAPFDLMPAVWLCSLLSVSAGLGAAAVFRRLWP